MEIKSRKPTEQATKPSAYLDAIKTDASFDKPLIQVFILGASISFLLTFLTIKAFFIPNSTVATQQMQRDTLVAQSIINNCVVSSTLSTSFRPDGTFDVSCIMDLNYMKQLEDLTTRAEKLRRLRQQEAKRSGA